MKIALVTGITGQDGSYLAEILLNKGYEVHGIKRRSSSYNTGRIDYILDNKNFKIHYGDLIDSTNLIRIIQDIKPDEIYNLGAQSHVKVSFETPEYTGDADALGTLRILEAIRILKMEDKVRFYQASTSEMFGKVQQVPQSENTSFYPRSPYGVAKLYAHWITKNYREAYNIFACSGILFNHESYRRGETFVTRKITMGLANILKGNQKTIKLGNLDARRDWGHAKDYMNAAYLMLQQDKPDDYVIATGYTYSVRDFAKKAFSIAGIDLEFIGEGINEKGVNKVSGRVLIEVDPVYFRPTEVDLLVGDATKAECVLNWRPTYSLDDIIEEMVRYDITKAK